MSKLGLCEEPLAAIARNLEFVLNSQRGYAAGSDCFGLGDHNIYEESKPHLDSLIADMFGQVRRHEPRLRAPIVRYVGREGSLWACFEISGRVLDEPQAFNVRFHVILRQVRVHPIASTA